MGKVADCRSEISSSNPTVDNFSFFLFSLLSSAFVEFPFLRKAEVFLTKKSSAFFEKLLQKYRYDRRFTDDLRPPHFRQKNSNYGSLGMLNGEVVEAKGRVITFLGFSICLFFWELLLVRAKSQGFPILFFCSKAGRNEGFWAQLANLRSKHSRLYLPHSLKIFPAQSSHRYPTSKFLS